MNMTDNFEPLESYDVLAIDFDGEDKQMFSHPTFRVSDLMEKIDEAFNYGITAEEKYRLFHTKGITCELLKSNSKGWRKGRIKLNIQLQFYPDEAESPLDDIRQKLKDIEQ
jgi:hypothetical protein